MKTYFLSCDEQNIFSLKDAPPPNPQTIIQAELFLTEIQANIIRRILTEANHKHQALKLASEVRFLQKRYYKARRNGDTKFNVNLLLTTSIDKETMLDRELEKVEKNYGKLYQDKSETLDLF